MKNRVKSFALLSLGFFLLPAARPVHAKIIFSGYADQRLTVYGKNKIMASAAALAAVPITETETRSLGFATDSFGIFSTTQFNDQWSFSADITHRQIGYTATELRVQYAFVNYEHVSGVRGRFGKVTLPIGYYNENHFYAFNRHAITGPVFQTAILGLPIADQGFRVDKSFALSGGSEISLVGFGVNGYGASNTAGTIFRPGLGATGALLLAQNLKPSNSNDHLSWGGRVEAAVMDNHALRLGASYYGGPWAKDTSKDFIMNNGYVRFKESIFEILAEYLTTHTQGDIGVNGFFGATDWKSEGWFTEGSVRLMRRDESELHGFAGAEKTVARATNGGSGVERLTGLKTGLNYKLNEFLSLRGQLNYLEYILPIQVSGEANPITIDVRSGLVGAVVTF